MTKRRLTIVQILPHLESGGVERGTLEVNKELVSHGHRSIVISSGGRLVADLMNDGGEHVTWHIGRRSPLSLRWVLPLRKFLAQNKVNILHARSRIPAWISYLAWKTMPQRSRPHFVTTAHGLYSINRYSEVMTFGERVISISEAVDHYLRVNYPRLNPARIRLIPRGIDPEEFPRGYRPDEAWMERWYQTYPQLVGRKVILLAGRLTRYKGHPQFLELVDLLRKDVPDVHALIVGAEDPRRRGYVTEIRERIRAMGLESYVTLTGHRSDIREIYAACDVALALSSQPPEAFGRSTVEALNIGTPVVGWDSGGTSELLRHIYPQGLVAPGDVQAAAARIRVILSQGAELAKDHPYLKERMLQKTLSLYEEIAA